MNTTTEIEGRIGWDQFQQADCLYNRICGYILFIREIIMEYITLCQLYSVSQYLNIYFRQATVIFLEMKRLI